MENKPKKQINVKKKIIQYIWVTIGVIITNIGFYFFMEPINLCAGGTMGLALFFKPLYSQLSWFTPSVFLYIINGICLILALIFLGKDFFFKTVYATFLSPTVVLVLELIGADQYYFLRQISDFKEVIDGSVITYTFGASTYIVCVVMLIFTMGIGVGICLKNHGSTGGMDVIQEIMHKKLKMPISSTKYFTDCVVVFIGGMTFIGGFSYNLETVLYGSVVAICTGYVVDFIALNARNRRTAYIITTKPDAIKEAIYKHFDRGVTYIQGTGGYTSEAKTIVMSTLDKRDAYKLKDVILEIDPDAFSFLTECKDVVGEYDPRGKIL